VTIHLRTLRHSGVRSVIRTAKSHVRTKADIDRHDPAGASRQASIQALRKLQDADIEQAAPTLGQFSFLP
jgi:hypothetical protein